MYSRRGLCASGRLQKVFLFSAKVSLRAEEALVDTGDHRGAGGAVSTNSTTRLQDQEDKADQDHRQGRGRTQSVTLQRNTGQAEVSCAHRDFERATTPRRQRESQLRPGLLSLPPPHSTMTVVVTAATDRGTSTNPSASRVTIPVT
jgi:hypothetical protein